MDNGMFNTHIFIVLYKKMFLKSAVINLKYLKNKCRYGIRWSNLALVLNFPLEDYLKLNAKYLRCGN